MVCGENYILSGASNVARSCVEAKSKLTSSEKGPGALEGDICNIKPILIIIILFIKKVLNCRYL